MKEERRFIRGIIPGLIFFIELIIVLLLVLNNCQKEYLLKYFSSRNIGDVLLVFLASGGIGYFLGILHRFIYWNVFQLNFSDILDRLENLNIIDLEIPEGKPEGPIKYKDNGAWRIINEIFYTRKQSRFIFGPEDRNDRLFDNMHSSGTSFIGFGIVAIIGIYYGYQGGLNILSLGSLLIIALLAIHYVEFKVSKRNAINFLEAVLLNELYHYKEYSGEPLKIYIPSRDIKNNKKHHDKTKKE